MSLTKVSYSLIQMPLVTATNIADATATINTTNKYEGLVIWDTTNKRMLRSSGVLATDNWDVVDGSVQITPV